MELLDRYLQAVRFWLPKRQQEDIIAELSEDLHSQVEEKELELGRPLTAAEIEDILKRCGSPIVVASRYRPQTQLIGPALFPIYLFILKLVLLWTLIPLFIGVIGPAMVLSSGHLWGSLARTLSSLWTALFLSAAIITLVFAVLERTQTEFKIFEKWDTKSLPPLVKAPQAPTRTHTIFELIFAVIGIVWLLAAPRFPFLFLGPAAAFLKPAPIWRHYYPAIILISLAGLAYQVVCLVRPQWTWFAPWGRVVTTALSLGVLYFILGTAMQWSGHPWQPFFLVDITQDTAHLTRLSAIANLLAFLALAATWLGLSIAGVQQTWNGLRHARRRFGPPCSTAPWRFLQRW